MKLRYIAISIIAVLAVAYLYFGGFLLQIVPEHCMTVYCGVEDDLDLQCHSGETHKDITTATSRCFSALGLNDVEDNKLAAAQSEWQERKGVCHGEVTLRYSGSGCPYDSTYFRESRVSFTGDIINYPNICENLTFDLDSLPAPPNCCFSGSGSGASCSWSPDLSSMSNPSLRFEINPELPPSPICGNNILESGEMCDDGNLVSNDGCSSSCQLEDFIGPPGCDEGWICLNNTHRAFQNTDCTTTNLNYCELGCEVNECRGVVYQNCVDTGCPLGSFCDEQTGVCEMITFQDCNDVGCPEGAICNEQSGVCEIIIIENITEPGDTGYVSVERTIIKTITEIPAWVFVIIFILIMTVIALILRRR